MSHLASYVQCFATAVAQHNPLSAAIVSPSRNAFATEDSAEGKQVSKSGFQVRGAFVNMISMFERRDRAYGVLSNLGSRTIAGKGVCELARDLSDIKTQFVRDRLKETKWADRSYIGILMHLEGSVELSIRGQSPGWAGGMMYAKMRVDYPVEYKCIKREMTEGIRTSFDEFINMQVDHDHEVAQREIEAAERSIREWDEEFGRQDELQRQWRELGGKN